MGRAMTHVLFICGKARMRSPTAADLVASWPGFTTDFAGTSADADEQVSAEQIMAADVICVMERSHAARLKRDFPAALRGRRLYVLNIPDRYPYGDPELRHMLEARLTLLLRV